MASENRPSPASAWASRSGASESAAVGSAPIVPPGHGRNANAQGHDRSHGRGRATYGHRAVIRAGDHRGMRLRIALLLIVGLIGGACHSIDKEWITFYQVFKDKGTPLSRAVSFEFMMRLCPQRA